MVRPFFSDRWPWHPESRCCEPTRLRITRDLALSTSRIIWISFWSHVCGSALARRFNITPCAGSKETGNSPRHCLYPLVRKGTDGAWRQTLNFRMSDFTVPRLGTFGQQITYRASGSTCVQQCLKCWWCASPATRHENGGRGHTRCWIPQGCFHFDD